MQKITAFFSVLLLSNALGAGVVFAQEFAEKPLMVVRFNQPRVAFERQLNSVLSQALAIKPTADFELVSNAPVTGNSNTDARWITTASHNTQAVASAMQRSGVSPEHLKLSGRVRPDLKFDETYLFVR